MLLIFDAIIKLFPTPQKITFDWQLTIKFTTLLNVLLKKPEAQAKNESSNDSIDQSIQSAS